MQQLLDSSKFIQWQDTQIHNSNYIQESWILKIQKISINLSLPDFEVFRCFLCLRVQIKVSEIMPKLYRSLCLIQHWKLYRCEWISLWLWNGWMRRCCCCSASTAASLHSIWYDATDVPVSRTYYKQQETHTHTHSQSHWMVKANETLGEFESFSILRLHRIHARTQAQCVRVRAFLYSG